MSDLSITLARTGRDTLNCRVEFDGRAARGTAELPPADAVEDLHQQTLDGSAPAGAYRAFADLLGRLLFAGDAGDLLREALDADSERLLLLSTESSLQGWPWELARDPQRGTYIVKEGARMVRVAGRSSQPTAIRRRGLLIVPAASGKSRAAALEASTRHLARKAEIDIFPSDPATGPALRRALDGGALLAHIEGARSDGRVALDDGMVPIERLGLNANCWFARLGGVEPNCDAALSLRASGVQVVLGRQAELRPRETAAVDRELYRALASGDHISGAVRRARQALSKNAGFSWAAPVLYVAPARGANSAVVQPFPPPFVGPQVESLAQSMTPISATLMEICDGSYPDLEGPPGHPVPAPIFIRDTIRMARGGASDPGELEARAAAMRALGTGTRSQPDLDPSLSPDERTAQLTDHLVRSIAQRDLPLAPPADLQVVTDRVAGSIAVEPGALRQAATALLAGPIVFVSAPGRGGERAARALAEQVFGYHPRLLDADTTEPLIMGPSRASDAQFQPGGWLYRVAASNWRRDQLDPLRAGEPGPTERMRTVSRRANGSGWRAHAGSWLVLNRAEHTDVGVLNTIARWLEQGLASGLMEGVPWRLKLPADFRVILSGRVAPEWLPAGIPVIKIGAHPSAEVEQARWLALTEQRCGIAEDAAATLVRRRKASVMVEILRFARVVCPGIDANGPAALAYAIEHPGGPGDAVDEALCLHVLPRLDGLGTAEITLLVAYLRGHGGAVFERGIYSRPRGAVDVALMRRFAEYLDALGGAEASRISALESALSNPDAPIVSLLDDWKQRGGLTPPKVRLPRLCAALALHQ